jgi:hypothetical protein
MDPYLEGSLWTSIHSQLAAEIARQLAPQVRPRYLALTTERLVYETSDGVALTSTSLYPDVGVLGPRGTSSLDQAANGGVAIAPVRAATVMPVAVPHVSVEIRDVANRELITAIEILSPTNKRGEGREEYLARRGRYLLSTAHLIEIDLLRQGARVPMQTPLPPGDYFVLVSRAAERPMVDIWPIHLSDRLPTVQVPLAPPDADVPLDLQGALTNIYDLLGYDLAIDYSRPPDVPLTKAQQQRIDQRLNDA